MRLQQQKKHIFKPQINSVQLLTFGEPIEQIGFGVSRRVYVGRYSIAIGLTDLIAANP